ncbi:MAG: rod shape-determining protein MreD [Candidatus Nealsonbacteria bacterium CG_4_9_14_0_2_um_filter_37_38]|uniref:Rod shape-determining protein MreD n=1 Tax=Candidatus Nealsonbacteria bacterium CG_4_10_14_0_8_um_filter_37_14 TaxID=1974684 RepID=A0A2M7R6C5_9BACT|nr:MAG: rod shape-determining protein MreD [Candidatus Nealsonbacteria bacterium CG11_big_fil_rev_8_21_14_0_20_37_68]PIW92123.1 MAG: rod shape-determining protein MreD [Candidatus Nealsonbacteria bacterium CG_4_8_14_3_um_filter_37_23]PIY88573.1 MAG: rod shape-determining protein MreD [Candidatus Nealsonbacteria bacterium CG_4_10_14_0_8_um_filter_37_14]PJC51436.1 MAG: rod shape-determining protein MreD [Candidatus Nealsonbacteria bacterium CG_4_9_14_0_2_um_filter_37_38]
MKNTLIIAIASYFFVLFQTSFLVYFNIAGFVPNFILILVIILSIFETSAPKFSSSPGMWVAIFGGFWLDIFSSSPIGFEVLICLAVSIFIKFVFKRHVRFPKKLFGGI